MDDETFILDAIRTVLQYDSHTVITACGGKAGIAAFELAVAQGEPFGVVMCDLNMPVVDGRDVVRAVKAIAPQTTVVLMSGTIDPLRSEPDVVVDAILAKPPTRAQLRALMRDLPAEPNSGKRTT